MKRLIFTLVFLILLLNFVSSITINYEGAYQYDSEFKEKILTDKDNLFFDTFSYFKFSILNEDNSKTGNLEIKEYVNGNVGTCSTDCFEGINEGKGFLDLGESVEYGFAQPSFFNEGKNVFTLVVKDLNSLEEEELSFDFFITEKDDLNIDIEAIKCNLGKNKYSVVLKNNGPNDIVEGCLQFGFDRESPRKGTGNYRCFGKGDYGFAKFFGKDFFLAKWFNGVDVFSKGERIKFSIDSGNFQESLPPGTYKVTCGFDNSNSFKGIYDDTNELNDLVSTFFEI
ncbi:hypothetical protein KAI04_01600 [Candidatus Pacearchaeota archaeon]|nr:hypothetical protein [Candidatus Pacearchaeota archaeon]